MLDLRGPELAADEREMLLHPLAGGVILFSRNYRDEVQLRTLTSGIHELREPPLLVAVDHEGGRVQRFHQEFTSLPACGRFGELYDDDPQEALRLAQQCGWLMAAELLAVGVDFSFAPVLDLDRGISRVIGDRAFHREPDTVAELARRFVRGMKTAGMAAVGKHFPGHGSVAADSHEALPVDARSLEDILAGDIVPFERLIASGLPAVMPAHVLYPAVDPRPAGFSPVWLRDVLREQLGFQGAIFSDDVSMAGAEVAGTHVERAEAALRAGCDMILVCNNSTAAAAVLETLDAGADPAAQVRLMRMHGAGERTGLTEIKNRQQWRDAAVLLAAIDVSPELGLGDDRT
jgi:beta-N-acetylhexosaminidase